ncbi:predicted protein [Aspergillus nidulans FGSC A4]|uniref:Uncharacterized protein n=1 Tax=Emericella nidulans (strain FGSC A4 / ATCC 38163 / CBS 112.46 / NRRL 194 / M139) TaxID=227321 RepID=Q5BEI8_EMENI|nr:hypothetical protein [Aspergillus nidulans FGSC A4]EAA65610.1 predicted protein [Aspergillus nidulans FGSC A4]CBF88274.1 TPA: conserved hypothetical protein [Aspergillus nidulans FGSC A4]|eukprot:XP_658646.1 predicted protein [Aspergillus nidulans FGSC A4]
MEETYLDLPIFHALFDSIKNDPEPQRSVSMKGLGTALLAGYFPIINGWIITQSRIQAAGSVVLRVQHYLRMGRDGQRPARIADHLLACVVHDTQDWSNAMEELDGLSAERWNVENGYCWVVVFHGLDVYFFCYRQNRPFGERYAGCGTRFFENGEEFIQNKYHLQRDTALIHEIMAFMASRTYILYAKNSFNTEP